MKKMIARTIVIIVLLLSFFYLGGKAQVGCSSRLLKGEIGFNLSLTMGEKKKVEKKKKKWYKRFF